jgi:SAM-dependent methyltransferase
MSYDQIPGWTCGETEALYRESAEKFGAQYRRGFNSGEKPTQYTVVEVGVAYGRSLAYLAERCTPNVRIVGVDVWIEHMGMDNLAPDVCAMLRKYPTAYQACVGMLQEHGGVRWGASSNPDARLAGYLGDTRIELDGRGSLPVAETFPDKSLDLVFIDACHEYEPVLADIRAWLPKVKPGGMLAGHDYSFEMFPGVVKAVQQVFAFGKEARPVEFRGVVWRVQL